VSVTRVLYVEDEALLAISMEGALLDAGCSVALAYDGAEGLVQAESFSPEIIVTDFMMPGMDGPTMLHILEQRGVTVPVVLTTAVPERDLAADVLERIDVYLAKPFTEEELVAVVSRLSRA
jgi:DNA-binding response OmpR family regulator